MLLVREIRAGRGLSIGSSIGLCACRFVNCHPNGSPSGGNVPPVTSKASSGQWERLESEVRRGKAIQNRSGYLDKIYHDE